MVDLESDDGSLLELALFAGAGGGILGGRLLGWRTVCAVEINQYAASVLCARQNDGTLEPFPIWGDIRSFRSRNPDCRSMFDMLRKVRHRLVISGGFPCQDISVAGGGAGLDGERSGLWSEQARIIREIRPRYAWVENSPALTGRGLHRVLGDLAALGYDARWGVLSAEDAIWNKGTPEVYHQRERIWIYCENADAKLRRISQRRRTATTGNCLQKRGRIRGDVTSRCQIQARKIVESSDSHAPQRKRVQLTERSIKKYANTSGDSWWGAEPNVGRVAYGVANRVDRLATIGNGQVPAVVELAWKVLSDIPHN